MTRSFAPAGRLSSVFPVTAEQEAFAYSFPSWVVMPVMDT